MSDNSYAGLEHRDEQIRPGGAGGEDRAIEMARDMNFNLGTALLFLWRAAFLASAQDTADLERARWYVEDEIKRRAALARGGKDE